MNRDALTALTLSLALALALAACGDNSEVHGVDTSDPRKVAQALVEASFACGEDGNGLIYDLTAEVDRRISREKFLELQRRAGCRPLRVPEDLQVSEFGRRGDFIGFQFKPAVSADEAGSYLPEGLADQDNDGLGSLTLVKEETGWRFRPRDGSLSP
jgi:hypothetical protein